LISSEFTSSYLNEYDPEIINANTSIGVPENTQLNAILLTITTRDNDTDSLSGAISSSVTDTSGGFFNYTLSGNDLSISLNKAFDFETAPTMQFTVTIYDNAPVPFQRTHTFSINVTIYNVDDECPYLQGVDSTLITLYEHDAIAATYTLTDADTTDSTLTLAVNGASPFPHTDYVTVNRTGVYPGITFFLL